MEIKELIQKAVDRTNEEELSRTEIRVERLVAEIFEAQKRLMDEVARIDKLKKELSTLQLPTTKSLDII